MTDGHDPTSDEPIDEPTDELFAGRPAVPSDPVPVDPARAGRTPSSDDLNFAMGELGSKARERASAKDDDSIGSFLKELPVLLLIAFGLAFLLRTFVVQVFYIPSASMRPTLLEDDRIVVEKISYLFGGPDRGDVVVFAGDEDPRFTEPETGVQRVVRGVGQFLGVVPVDAHDLVKRVIGLPGDEVVMVDGVVSVNGVELDEPYAMLDSDDGEWTVPEGQLFVMGDNRSNSADSRSTLGYVDVDDIVGRAVIRIWPVDRFGSIEGDGDDFGDGEGGALPAAMGLAPVVGFVVRKRAA